MLYQEGEIARTNGFGNSLGFWITTKSKISAFGTSIASDFSTISKIEKEFAKQIQGEEIPLFVYKEEEDRDSIAI